MTSELLSKSNGTTSSPRINVYSNKPVIETLTNGYFAVDNNWKVKSWNKAAEKLLGVSASEVVGKNFWHHFAEKIPVEFYAVYNRAFLKDIPVHFLEYWAEMGAWFDVTTWYSENTLYVSFKRTDLLYPKNPDTTRERLNTLTELYKFVTEITNDCLWEWDLKANEIFWIDGGHKRVFGYPIENLLIPVSFWEMCIHPADRVRVVTKLKATIRDGDNNIWEEEYRFRKSDGTYCHVCDRGRIVYDENNEATRIIGATQDITKRVMLQNELALQKLEQQREITNAVMTALETDRTSIGMELHDNLGQMLAVSKMYLQMARRNVDDKDANIDKSILFIKNVIDEIRKMSKTLVIPPAHIISLSDNIKVLVEDIVATDPIKLKYYEIGLDDIELPDLLQINIFRIIQEQLNNILKHSSATRASISLTRDKSELILVIADNGKGHDMAKEKTGVGIINIKSRVDLLLGNITINSHPGEGYELKAIFPLDNH
jgi:PAS domain S-box-containing protein